MDKEQIQLLIIKYKNGLCDADEINSLLVWVEQQGADNPDFLFGDSYHEDILKEEIRANINTSLFGQKSNASDRKLQFWFKIAAFLLLACSVGVLIWLSSFNNGVETFTTIYNPPGQLKTIFLPDGSKVFLNAATTIRFSNRFDGEFRKINLVGEAYFNVLHNDKKPFIVYTGKIRTQVLGTSFNIKAYNNEPTIKVAVISGKVGVIAGNATAIITPNQTIDYDANSGKLVKTNVEDATSLKSWTVGELIFQNQSLNDISHVLTRHYNIDIIIENWRLSNTLLNVRFDKDESIEKVVSVLCNYVGARYRHDGNRYIIK